MKLAENLTNSFYAERLISAEEKPIFRFGLESLIGNLLSIIMVFLSVGICFKRLEDALLLCLLSFPLRKNAGGYHAPTKTRCLFISLLMLITASVIFTKFKYALTFYGINVAVNGCIIWFLAPIDNSSKMLDAAEFKVYRKRSRIILVTECIIITLSLHFKWEAVVRSGCMALFITSMSLLMGGLKNHSKKGYS